MAAFAVGAGKTLWQLLPDVLRLESYKAVPITGMSLDSRELAKGDLFIALAGANHDGRAFIAQAINTDCAAIVAEAQGFEALCPQGSVARQLLEKSATPLVLVANLQAQVSAIAGRFYDSPGKAMTLFGITGTNGKTTCASLISQVQGQLNGVSGLVGTLGYGIVSTTGSGTTATGMTTPDAVSLQKILAHLRAQGVASVAMEVSSHSLAQHRVDDVGIDYAIFTNLSRDHLDYHGDEQQYGAAKAALFSLAGVKAAIINSDDPFGAALLAQLPAGLKAYSYGLNGRADIRATHIDFSASGVRADIRSPWGQGRLHSSLLGEFNLLNLLAVIAAVCASGAKFDQVLATIPQLQPVSGRMEVVSPDARPTVIVDYAHTPDALEKVLIALRQHCGGKLWCIFGCGGDRDSGKRPLMAAVAEQFADRVVVTSDNPRNEDPGAIITDIMKGFTRPQAVKVEVNRGDAIRWVVAEAADNDRVLVAGKGHENYQQIGSAKLPFSDQLEARNALNDRTRCQGRAKQ